MQLRRSSPLARARPVTGRMAPLAWSGSPRGALVSVNADRFVSRGRLGEFVTAAPEELTLCGVGRPGQGHGVVERCHGARGREAGRRAARTWCQSVSAAAAASLCTALRLPRSSVSIDGQACANPWYVTRPSSSASLANSSSDLNERPAGPRSSWNVQRGSSMTPSSEMNSVTTILVMSCSLRSSRHAALGAGLRSPDRREADPWPAVRCAVPHSVVFAMRRSVRADASAQSRARSRSAQSVNHDSVRCVVSSASVRDVTAWVSVDLRHRSEEAQP